MASEKTKLHFKACLADCPRKYPELWQEVQQKIKQNAKPAIEESIAAIKWLIKEKVPARDKFHALCLLRDIMELNCNDHIYKYFASKVCDRLKKIALHKQNEKLEERRGQSCLDEYFADQSPENKAYSLQFYRLLLECWQSWLLMFGAKQKKIKAAAEKIRHLFPKEQ